MCIVGSVLSFYCRLFVQSYHVQWHGILTSERVYGCSVVTKAGDRGHILNLGHGVLVGTPEEGVAHFFDTARSLTYNTARPLSSVR